MRSIRPLSLVIIQRTYILNLDGTAVNWWTMAKWETTRFLVTTIGLSIFYPFLYWQWERRCTCNKHFFCKGEPLKFKKNSRKNLVLFGKLLSMFLSLIHIKQRHLEVVGELEHDFDAHWALVEYILKLDLWNK